MHFRQRDPLDLTRESFVRFCQQQSVRFYRDSNLFRKFASHTQ
jgi:hypothetical protein